MYGCCCATEEMEWWCESATVSAFDGCEAIRLADLEGLYQEQAAERMIVSRPTFGRILAAAHRKVAEALAHGKILKIEGGTVRMERLHSLRGIGMGAFGKLKAANIHVYFSEHPTVEETVAAFKS